MTGTEPVYDRIGRSYATGRRPDPRWQARIDAALGGAATVINVGAGTGSYEPRGRRVFAVEPSPVMISQRGPSSAHCIRGVAEYLPFTDGVADVAMAILSVHHWADLRAGLAEMQRVARRQLVLTFEAQLHAEFWLCDYIPAIADFQLANTPSVAEISSLLGADEVEVLPVPDDMCDSVLIANWQRPEAYLDPQVRACCSGLALLDPVDVAPGIERLRTDLADGTWDMRYGDLRTCTEYDGGFRLVSAG